MMARSLSVDSGYDRWKDSAVEQRSREPIGTFPSVTVRTGRSGNITDALVSTTEYQTNSGEKGEAQVQGMSGAPVDGSGWRAARLARLPVTLGTLPHMLNYVRHHLTADTVSFTAAAAAFA